MGATVMRSPSLNGIGSVYFRMYCSAGVQITCTLQVSADGESWDSVNSFTSTANSLETAHQFSATVNDRDRLFARFVLTKPPEVSTATYVFIGHINVARFGEAAQPSAGTGQE